MNGELTDAEIREVIVFVSNESIKSPKSWDVVGWCTIVHGKSGLRIHRWGGQCGEKDDRKIALYAGEEEISTWDYYHEYEYNSLADSFIRVADYHDEIKLKASNSAIRKLLGKILK